MLVKAAPSQIGFLSAVAIGVGAIVGGGILVLAGVAFTATGPGAIVAFALNGVIALLTALSFAEMSTAFPESGGAYIFAKKVLSVRAAFVTGWILWFAYIVAGSLYALGFASYAVEFAVGAWPGTAPTWLDQRRTHLLVAVIATSAYAISLIRKPTGGAEWATWGKLVLFGVLIAAGIWGAARRPFHEIGEAFSPFFSSGGLGLIKAMGFTFIALQGFEIIAAVAGEVANPERALPRAMLASLGIALVVYLPLLFVVVAAGTAPGEKIAEVARAAPATIMATAVKRYLGAAGYWMVVVAALMATLSALHANILAASRVALTMARDRTLPPVLATLHGTRGTPAVAIYTSALALVAFLFMLPDLSAAGAAASLIFLLSFALAHGTSLLARVRTPVWPPRAFRSPWFPAVPVVGGVACAALAIFQAGAVPAAGAVTAIWLGLGVVLYLGLFSPRAQRMDAWAEARDPKLVGLRGRAPLVLVPVANPDQAPALAAVATALAPPGMGKVLLFSSVDATKKGENAHGIDAAQYVLRRAVDACLEFGHRPEALLTVAPEPWSEISRIAREHRCEGLLLGHPDLDEKKLLRLENVMNNVDCDVALFKAPPNWRLADVKTILVPAGGRSRHQELRARLLGSLGRETAPEIRWLQVLPCNASAAAEAQARRTLLALAEDTSVGAPQTLIERDDDFARVIIEHSKHADLLVLGLHRTGTGRRAFGKLIPSIAMRAHCATIVISRGR